MSRAILVIDDIPESMFTEKISIIYKLIYYPDGHLKELGICGKQLLKPLPQKKEEIDIMETITGPYGKSTIILEKVIEKARQQGYNLYLKEILGEENDE